MVDKIRSEDFLPEVFKTPTNKKFLNTTLDQLIQEPDLKKIQGFIGKHTLITSDNDIYLNEATPDRTDYQLEPGIIFKNGNGQKVDALTYPGLVDSIAVKDGKVADHDRLFSNETYSWNPFIDFDKFINYTQYVWLPAGPDSVNVTSENMYAAGVIDINRNETTETYSLQNDNDENPTLTLVRGETYIFAVNQQGNPFYIQSHLGTDGLAPWSDLVTTRDVLGVVNNGEDVGTITFTVPSIGAQDFYSTLNDIGTIDFASTLVFNDINNHTIEDVRAILDIQDIENKTIIFLGSDTTYKMTVVGNDIVLIFYSTIIVNNRFKVLYSDNSNIDFYMNSANVIEQIPIITANIDTLYYQDANESDMFGIINILNSEDVSDQREIDINTILGTQTYTSPNGVDFTNGLKVKFKGNIVPVEYLENEYYIEGVGTNIKLLPVSDFIVPEPHATVSNEPWDIFPWDSTNYSGRTSEVFDIEYITINRGSSDLNAWTRSNRWFHVDIVNKTAEYNNTIALIDNDSKAKRPIIEFEPNLKLINHNVNKLKYVDVIDFSQPDAFSNVNGTETYTVNSRILSAGTTVIFANDQDVSARSKIYKVQMVDLNNNGTNVIVLTYIDDISNYDGVLITSGDTKGYLYVYEDNAWINGQRKTSSNQQPLYDLFDINGTSLSNQVTYPATTFGGSKLFSYKEGKGPNDAVLKFPLTFQSINNIGDIVFENNYYTDEFIYVVNAESTTGFAKDALVREYNASGFNIRTGWVKTIERSYLPQIFRISYTGDPIILDVLRKDDIILPALKVFNNSIKMPDDEYTISEVDGSTIVTITTALEPTDLEVHIISDSTSNIGYYQVPSNLSRNAFNEDNKTLTLGAIRNHVTSILNNIDEIGAIRDFGNFASYGDLIIQHSSPVPSIPEFIRKKEYNFFDALQFNSYSYEKYKNKILNWVIKNEIFELSVSEILETAIKEINGGKNYDSSFFQTDMLPFGGEFETTTHIVTSITNSTFSTINVYDFSKASNQSILVYLNNELLLKDYDYTVLTDSAAVTINRSLALNDEIMFHEYSDTTGSCIPNTPTKMGLYNKYKPEKFADDTYFRTTFVIRGHDGSITPAFDDIRDEVLLEFEKRIYNNIKIDSEIPLQFHDIQPGQYRDTDYFDLEVSEILSESMLSWVGWNKLDYKTQDYRADIGGEKTWNYSSSSSILDGELFKGNWRGIYNFYYDTDSPHLRPWEMLGFSEEPYWWQAMYGVNPYTSGNLVLWNDLAEGRIREPNNDRIDPKYKRPYLLDIIPVNDSGELLMPLEVVVAHYSSVDFKQDWKIGDQGPVETAFMKSSVWPFAVQRLLALTKPADYFSLMIDRDRYVYNAQIEQFLYDGRHRLDVRNIEIASDTVMKHSYINWIIDYNKHYGYSNYKSIVTDLANIDINLCYRMAGFTDKNMLTLFTDNSNNNSNQTVPDESYDLLFYRNQPFEEITYSAVMVQSVDEGYVVTGNSTTTPYFKINRSISTGNYDTLVVQRTDRSISRIRYPKDFTNDVVLVPYGTVFPSKSVVVDFLASYESFLVSQGLIFDTIESDIVEVNWQIMAKEFIYWADTGWETSSAINLNPCTDTLHFKRDLAIVDNIVDLTINEQPQDHNGYPLHIKDYVIDRIDNTFKLNTINDTMLNFLNFHLTSFEHLLILDNTSIFDDLMYEPTTGIRQNRLKVSGLLSANWNGQLDANGFLYNNEIVNQWKPLITYNKGDMVTFKNSYWTADSRIDPANEFNYGKWIKIDYNLISTGLLPNIATRADQLIGYYDKNIANLDYDADLLSMGLIGFRPRDYMRDLNLDDISQVGVYSSLIETKGTINNLELFRKTKIDNRDTEYEIYENWAVKRAEFGATSSRSYVELRLDSDKLTSTIPIVQIVDDSELIYTVDQTVHLSNIYKQSVNYTSLDIFPITDERKIDTALPTAGFVSVDDVDIALFNNTTDLDNATDTIKDGSTIWVAKDTAQDWNVYEAKAVGPELVSVTNNFNGFITMEFNGSHGLRAGDIIVVKFFDDRINKSYFVQYIDTSIRIIVMSDIDTDEVTIDDKKGFVFKLASVRMETPSAVLDSHIDNDLFKYPKAWINNDNKKFSIYEKIDPYIFDTKVQDEEASSNYGRVIKQGKTTPAAIVSNSHDNNNSGVVHFYNRRNLAISASVPWYELNQIPSDDYLSAYAVYAREAGSVNSRYGAAVAMGDEWVAVTSNGVNPSAVIIKYNSGTFIKSQTLTPPVNANTGMGLGFGTAVALSDDEFWLFISEPIENKVHSFQRIDYDHQTMELVGDGVQTIFNISSAINITNELHITVRINNQLISVNDFVYDAVTAELIFDTPPPAGARINIKRNDMIGFETANLTVIETDSLYIPEEASVKVYINEELISTAEYSVDIVSSEIVLHTPITTISYVSVRIDDYFTSVGIIEIPESEPGDNFGFELATTETGDQLIVSAVGDPIVCDPADEVCSPYLGIAKVYVFDRVIERFVVTDINQQEYVLKRSVPENSLNSVYSNTVELTQPYKSYPDYSFNSNGNLVLNYEPALGDYLDVDINEFKLVHTNSHVDIDTKFGSSLALCKTKCSMYIGAPYETTHARQNGTVTRYINTSRIYGVTVSENTNPVLTPGDTIRINRFEVPVVGDTVELLSESINDSNIPNVTSIVMDGRLVVELIDKEIKSYFNKLELLPGEGTAYFDLGFSVYSFDQTIDSPIDANHQRFGNAIELSDNSQNLVISAESGTAKELTQFESGLTSFDGNTMRIIDNHIQTGAVYTYDLLPGDSIYSAGKFIFGRQVWDNKDYERVDGFGHAISLSTNRLMVGAPGLTTNTVTAGHVNVYYFNNLTSWIKVQEEDDLVDSDLINSIMIYNKDDESQVQHLDYIDPLNGKILGAARENIDYITVYDPASYQTNSSEALWGKSRVGKIWWDVDNVRFLDYNKEDTRYSSSVWGKTFTGSTIDIYQWIESSVLPEDYAGDTRDENYVTLSIVNNDNIIVNTYYFWAKNVEFIIDHSGKTLSANAISQYIQTPTASGIPYAVLLDRSTIGLVNSNSYFRDIRSILHVEYDTIKNDNNVFVEYDLLKDGDKNDFLQETTYKKLIDSFCGSDSVGNLVPDPNLSLNDRYGIKVRPRQSMFKDKYTALNIYFTKVNTELRKLPIGEYMNFPLLLTSDPLPDSSQWEIVVNTLEELYFQDTLFMTVGDRVLVKSDSTQQGFWSVYQLNIHLEYDLIRIQIYDTALFWEYTDWYAPGYNKFVKPSLIVDTVAQLPFYDVEDNTVVKVTSNGNNKWEIHKYNSGWDRIALEDGTFQFKESLFDYSVGKYGWDADVFDLQNFDKEPIQETRNILRSINEEIFVNELTLVRNQLLTLMFRYILSEQDTVDWLYLTSLLDVNHKVKSLIQEAIYKEDNQTAILDYVTETKPFHCKIKEFVLTYDAHDTDTDLLITDFDCQSHYSLEYDKNISPILDDVAFLVTDDSNYTHPEDYPLGGTEKGDLWKERPWKYWYNNRGLDIQSVTVTNGGSGYLVQPIVTAVVEELTPEYLAKANPTNDPVVAERLLQLFQPLEDAVLTSRITNTGELKEIVVEQPGKGYRNTPKIVITDLNGSGATAYANTDPNLIRSMDLTIKYDRYEYSSDIKLWNTEDAYAIGERVRYANRVFTVTTAKVENTQFIEDHYTLVDVEVLSGIDRTYGLYVADVNNPGLDLSLLVDGIIYPGVNAKGVSFNEGIGFDNHSYDIVDWDSDIFDDSILDTTYASQFVNTYLGTAPSDIDVHGGKFVDTYHSHAPEELVPGMMYDTLNLEVRTRPGADWSQDGHAFAIDNYNFELLTLPMTVPFNGVSELPITIRVANNTTGCMLYEDIGNNLNYTVDWINHTLTINDGALIGDSIKLIIGSIGGGDVLYRTNITGAELINGTDYILPVAEDEIRNVMVFRDGFEIATTLTPIDDYSTLMTIASSINSYIAINVIGETGAQDENYYNTETFISEAMLEAQFNISEFNNAVFANGGNIVDQFLLHDDPSVLTELNAIVEHNGKRLRSAEARRYFADGYDRRFELPSYSVNLHGEYQADIADTDVVVFANGIEQILGVDYIILAEDIPIFSDALNPDPLDDTFNNTNFYHPNVMPVFADANHPNPLDATFNSTAFHKDKIQKYVEFINLPESNTRVEVYVTTYREYEFIQNEVVLDTLADAGDIVSVTTYGDPDELYVISHVYEGPTVMEIPTISSSQYYSDTACRIVYPEFSDPNWDVFPWDYHRWDITGDSVADTSCFDVYEAGWDMLPFDEEGYSYSNLHLFASLNGSDLYTAWDGGEEEGDEFSWDATGFDMSNINIDISVAGTTCYNANNAHYDPVEYFCPTVENDPYNIYRDTTFDNTATVFENDTTIFEHKIVEQSVILGEVKYQEIGVNRFKLDPIDMRMVTDHNSISMGPVMFTNPDRLWVTVNGERLNSNSDFSIEDNWLYINTDIQDTDIINVTTMTENVSTNGVAFRLFKDMRDNTAFYGMNPRFSTKLSQELLPEDTVIHVMDASKISTHTIYSSWHNPELGDIPSKEVGIVILNGERITFTEIDRVANTLSGLRRGTAGTAINTHIIYEDIWNMGKDALVPEDYDKIWYAQGKEIDFNLGFDVMPYTELGYDLLHAPVVFDVDFDDPNYDFTILPSNGITLQEQETVPAKFLKT